MKHTMIVNYMSKNLKDMFMLLPSICHCNSFKAMITVYYDERNNNNQITCIIYMNIIILLTVSNISILYLFLGSNNLYHLIHNLILLDINQMVYFHFMFSIYFLIMNINYFIHVFVKIYIDLNFDSKPDTIDHTNFLALSTISCK